MVILVVRFLRRRKEEPAWRAPITAAARLPVAVRSAVVWAAALAGAWAVRCRSRRRCRRRAGPPAQRDEVGIGPQDFDAFERTLTQVQLAYGAEDAATLRRLTTPEMFGYFGEEIRANTARGVVNKIADVKLQQGDLAEAWREGRSTTPPWPCATPCATR